MRKITLIALFVFAAAAFAEDPVNKTILGNAVDGYDVVAYFTQGKPVEGSRDHEFEWRGATWKFASAEHRALFAKSPDKYAPQYGGFCAFGVSRGYAVGIDPEAWTIFEGKLYLNYNRDVQAEWVKDIPGFIAKANANWPKIVAEKTKP